MKYIEPEDYFPKEIRKATGIGEFASEKRYYYGMRLRPFDIGCQPKHDFVACEEPSEKWKRYWSIIIYSQPLTEEECTHYSLDLLEVRE